MAKNTSISLGEDLEKFVNNALAAGRYGSASEVVRAGLRLLEKEEARLKTLRNALNSKGETPFDQEKWLEENKSSLDAHNARIEKHGLAIKAHWM